MKTEEIPICLGRSYSSHILLKLARTSKNALGSTAMLIACHTWAMCAALNVPPPPAEPPELLNSPRLSWNSYHHCYVTC